MRDSVVGSVSLQFLWLCQRYSTVASVIRAVITKLLNVRGSGHCLHIGGHIFLEILNNRAVRSVTVQELRVTNPSVQNKNAKKLKIYI